MYVSMSHISSKIKETKAQNQKFLGKEFFDRDTLQVAKELIGKIIFVKACGMWLKVRITSTEAYYRHDKASHASLGYTAKRKALFMPSGTIYMYHSRGGPSFNVSTCGAGNAVLIKFGVPYLGTGNNAFKMLSLMQKLNPKKNSNVHNKPRAPHKLCVGQALLCRSLGLSVNEWDQKQFRRDAFYIADIGIKPARIIQTTRLGIPKGRDEHLPYRFIDEISDPTSL